MIVYVLINMALGLLNEFIGRTMAPYVVDTGASEPVTIPADIVMLSFFLIIFMFWGFRLFWLNIPFSLNMSMRDYMRAVRGAMPTLQMIAIWLLCFAPFIMALKIVWELFGAPIVAGMGAGVGNVLNNALSAFVDTLKSLVAVAGITFALRTLMTPASRTNRIV
ncbi:MAG: hypothetical protein DI551_05535 [Micavibrio aeruginosavorus]|uniref:Uncharacterized protein n=1 Tax=Micavibrio aeruginosavorus TaxID=349221 RepID=A0A2W5MY92_9BACT|nr:MAG: hypothetical protein DI551_05535 [Micavibrio aeruginosavorus]